MKPFAFGVKVHSYSFIEILLVLLQKVVSDRDSNYAKKVSE
jgi:hypothetical protein